MAWAETLDLRTRDAEAALAAMAWTARYAPELKRAAGVPAGGVRSRETPALQVSLSWHPEERAERRLFARQREGGRSVMATCRPATRLAGSLPG